MRQWNPVSILYVVVNSDFYLTQIHVQFFKEILFSPRFFFPWQLCNIIAAFCMAEVYIFIKKFLTSNLFV